MFRVDENADLRGVTTIRDLNPLLPLWLRNSRSAAPVEGLTIVPGVPGASVSSTRALLDGKKNMTGAWSSPKGRGSKALSADEVRSIGVSIRRAVDTYSETDAERAEREQAEPHHH